jgi:hypothetical protein
MAVPPIVRALPEIVYLTTQVVTAVEGMRSRAAQARAGADVEPAVAAAVAADDALDDVVAEAEVLAVRQVSERNRLQYALDRARRDEQEARDAALALDHRRRDDPAAIQHMARAQTRGRDADQLAADLVEAEAHVEQAEDFLRSARAHQEDVRRTVASLRRRYERAERLTELTRLTDRMRQRLDGVDQLTEEVESFQADAAAGWEVNRRAPDQLRHQAHGRLRDSQAAEELARRREQR